MKASPVLLLLTAATVTSVLFGQVDSLAVPVPREHRKVIFKLKPDERRVDSVFLEFTNTTNSPLTIQGVQSSPNLFVVDFPKTVAAGKTVQIELAYEAAPNSSSDADVIRVKTSRGIFPIEVQHDREKLLTVSGTELKWAVGGSVAAQTVDITVSQAAANVKGARVGGGEKHKAEITSLGGGKYRLTVTPASTDRPTRFPVFVELDRDLPGSGIVVLCVVSRD